METKVINLKNVLRARETWKISFSTRIEFRKFVMSFESFEQFEKFENGYNDGLIGLDDFLAGNFWDAETALCNDDYVLTREGTILHLDECNFCGGYEEYTTRSVFRCHIGYSRSNEIHACRQYINENDFYYYEGEYYDADALSANDLVFMNNGNIEHIDHVYYWESDDEYHYDEETEQFTREYHNTRFQEKVIFSKEPRFFIGIEVEKEDEEIKESINIDDFENECVGYRKERDGSLDDASGFELITPPYELNAKKIIELISENKTLVSHFNAGISRACGGHINLSEDGLTGEELFEKIKGYTPLFNALYFKRLTGRWCKAKSNEKLIEDKEKYQSIRIHSNRVEFRLISALRDIDQLDWRLRLFELIVKNPTSCPREAFYIIHSKFKKHLKKVYKDNFETLNARIIEMTKDFENINLI